MKATDLLKTQHQEVNAMFEQIEQAEGEQALPLVEQLVSMLLAHSMIEKEIFYPAASEAPEAKKLYEAYEEHSLVEFEMQKLLSTKASDESFHARVSVLKELVQHHVGEEENEVLAKADQMMPEEQLEELGTRMEQQFEMLKAGNIQKMLAEQVEQAMPRTTTRRRASSTKQGTRRTASRTTSKRATPKRASKGGRSTTARKQAAAKGGRASGGRSTTARKQAAAKGGRASSSSRSSGSKSRSTTGQSSGGRKGGSSRRSSSGSR